LNRGDGILEALLRVRLTALQTVQRITKAGIQRLAVVALEDRVHCKTVHVEVQVNVMWG
jgi:hypothetical protein